MYVSYYPDLAVPGAVEAVRSFAELAVENGVRRLVLLSGRGEPEAERTEAAVRDSGADLAILRSTWFMQNFSEDYMLEHVLSGEIRLPAGDVPTPFLDVDDITDVAVAGQDSTSGKKTPTGDWSKRRTSRPSDGTKCGQQTIDERS